MRFNWFTSKLVTPVAALALGNASANAAITKGNHDSRRTQVIAVSALDDSKTTEAFFA